jgi:hypothetical protein
MPGEAHRFVLDVPYVRATDVIPQALKQAMVDNRCILFLGAGASLGATDPQGNRLPSWETFVLDLLNEIERENPQDQNIHTEIQDLVNLGELLALSEWIDLKLSSSALARYIRVRLSEAKDSRVHEVLSKKAFAAVLTTNYDNLAEDYLTRAGRHPFTVTPHTSVSEISVAEEALRDKSSRRVPVIKPHGTWERPDTVVFGPRSFRQIMFSNDAFRQFMLRILTDYTLFFVGLSFKDPNLQSLMQWARTIAGNRMPLHYATMENRGPVFKQFMQENFGIRLLTYPVPPRDHSAAFDIFDQL